MKKRFWAVLAVILCMTGCQGNVGTGQVDTAQVAAESQQTEHITVISETPNVDTAIKVQTEKDNSNIIVDKEKSAIYYFFKDKETVDLSKINDSLEEIDTIYIVPLNYNTKGNEQYRFKEIIGFDETQNTNGVRWLNITGGNLNNLSFLNNMKNLDSVSLSFCDIKNTSAISENHSVVGLHITDCDIDNILFLENMPQLEYLTLDKTLVTDLSPISSLINIQDISLAECGITDLSAFESYKEFNQSLTIDLSGNVIDDFAPLGNINVYQLFLQNTKGSNYDTLKNLTAYTVYLEENNLTNIDFLCGNNINILFLEDNHISDWSPLLNVDGLEWVYAFDNMEISDNVFDEYKENGIVLARSKIPYPN